MTPCLGRIVSVAAADDGRWAIVDVRGARLRVAADLVPQSAPGDTVVIVAGVALAVVGETREPPSCA